MFQCTIERIQKHSHSGMLESQSMRHSGRLLKTVTSFSVSGFFCSHFYHYFVHRLSVEKTQHKGCVSDPKAAREVVFGQNGILQYVNSKKAYVDMSTVDPETAEGILIIQLLNKINLN